MKFGITAPYRMGPLETGEYAAAFARIVEDAGFESVWAVEHVVMSVEYESVYPYDPSGRSPFDANTVQPDPLIWLSYVAAATTRLRLGTAVLILPQHNPVILAKSIATLDRLSGGRMMLGTGVGWVEEEARAVGSSFSDRGRRASEYIRAMRALWNEPVASFEGVFVNFSNVVCEPRPIQPGGVPIHIGGHSPAAARRAGRLGDGFYPLGVDPDSLADLLGVMEGAAREAGRDPAAIEITCSGSPRAELACRYRDVGIDRMVVFPPTGDLEKLALFLETFRRDAVEKLA